MSNVKFHTIKFHINEVGRGWVELDGKKLNGVRDIKVDAGVERVTAVNLTLLCDEVCGDVNTLDNPLGED